jgi:hypothetical protein
LGGPFFRMSSAHCFIVALHLFMISRSSFVGASPRDIFAITLATSSGVAGCAEARSAVNVIEVAIARMRVNRPRPVMPPP